MGRHKTKEEWIEWFRMFKEGKDNFWELYLSQVKHNVPKTIKSVKFVKKEFKRKYRKYKLYGDSIITSMTGKYSGPNKGRPKAKREIDWDFFTREELVEIAKRYEEIMEEKKKKEKMKEGQNFTFRISAICYLMGISMSGYYKNQSVEYKSKRNKNLESEITKLFHDNKQIYGRDRIAILLKNKGLNVSYRTVGRYMCALNLTCKTRMIRKKREIKNTNVKYLDLVKRNYNGEGIISTDVSYIPVKSNITNHAYLSVAIDHKTKEVLSHNFSLNNDIELVTNHFRQMDLDNKIVHSDHGNQYSSVEFKNLSQTKNFRISMSRIGNSLDNRESEYFFSNLKSEVLTKAETYKLEFSTVKKIIDDYISWYNKERIQSILNWKTPEQARMFNV